MPKHKQHNNKPKARKLRKNKTVRHPEYFLFVDTETTQIKISENRLEHNFRLGVAIRRRLRKDGDKSKREVLRFTDVNMFWDYADRSFSGKNTLHIIAHNMLFDMAVLEWFKHLERLDYRCKFVFDQGVTFISKWVKGDKRIVLLDNSNWFKGKLSKWGDILKLPKLEMPDTMDVQEKWFVYCERDTEILEKLQLWLIEFLKDNDLGNWKYTLASLSFNSYRHRFMKHPIYIPQRSSETDIARKSYRGGRTEVFRTGEFKGKDFYKLDINSMYPAVMANNMYPTAVEGINLSPSITDTRKALRNNLVIGKLTINVSEPYFPITLNNKTVYPLGQFTTYLTTPEIRLCIDNNWVKDVHNLIIYRQREIFTEFVLFFYNQRLKYKRKGDTLRTLMFKLLMNSLYGKFGQRGYDDRVIGNAKPGTWETCYHYDPIKNKRSVIRQIGSNIIQSSRKGEGYNAFCAVAAHVTAYARIMLYDFVKLAGRENTYYCDTDSVIVNRTGYDNLLPYCNPDTLGLLKLEGQSNYLDIVSPKHYTFGSEWKCKGIRKNAELVGVNKYKQEIWPGLNSILAHNPNKYYNTFVVKEIKAKVESGIIKKGGIIEPFVLMQYGDNEPKILNL